LSRLRLAAAALCVALAFGAGATADVRLERALAESPDDPDLAWARVRDLAAGEASEETVASLESFLARWPHRRPEANLLLGRQLSALGRDEEAIPKLERATADLPRSGAARFHLALALRAVGRLEEADRQLAFAARLAPELAAEASLLRALGRLDSDDPDGAQDLLQQVIELDPEGEAARGARLMLSQLGTPRPNMLGLRFDGYAGMQYDDNVRLESGAVPGSVVDGDFAGTWGSTLSWDIPLAGLGGEGSFERFSLATGLRYDSRDFIDVDDFDTQEVSGFASARWKANDRVSLGLDSAHGRAFLAEEAYSSLTHVRPNLTWAAGERGGVLRLWGRYQWVRYENPPLFSSLERDGEGYGVGIEHFFALPGLPRAWAGWLFDWRRSLTDAEPDLLGFEGDYDHDRYRGGLRGHVGLPWSFSLDGAATLAQERYLNDNLVDFLSRLLSGEAGRPRRREDLVVDTRLALTYELSRRIDIELQWSFLERLSNADLYDYDRNSLGLAVRLKAF
jgi:tetratricopeptide (TPR) repeat protein